MSTVSIPISEKAGAIDLIVQENQDANKCLILAHGAGAGMEHPFMKSLAQRINEAGIHVIRFNFPYKQRGKKMPGSPKEAILAFKKVTEYANETFPDCSVFISGKSYGGRMASHMAAENPDLDVSGLIYFGFPLHAPGKASKDRAQHLVSISMPQLFLQGTNDALANIDLIKQVVEEQKDAKLITFEGADHSFKTPKTATQSTKEVFDQLVVQSVSWIKAIK